MKYRIINISLLVLLILSLTLSAGESSVRYIVGYVNNVNNNIITLTNNLVLQAEEHVSAISMTPVTIVLDNEKNEGYTYIKNRKVNITVMQKTVNNLYVPALRDKIITYNIGELTRIDKIDLEKRQVLLTNGDVWTIKLDEDKNELKKWSENSEVIVTKNNTSTRITNIVTSGYINVMNKTNNDSVKSTK